MKKQAVIFDMDGVIIDSEPLWQQAQDAALSQYGVSVTPKQCEDTTMGMRVDAIAQTWCDLFKLTVDPKQLEGEIIERLEMLIAEQGQPMQGVYQLLDYLTSLKMKIGLATSSNQSVIEAVFNKLELWDYFDITCSAEHEKHGKPAPDVYLTAAQKLGIPVDECIVIEDSYNGMLAAKNAHMTTFVVCEQCQADKFIAGDAHFYHLDEVVSYCQEREDNLFL
ncbi:MULTISPECIES: hexitol phosphatase HxpB [Vibrio]|uniref:Hexitol phosphatase HxpB n=2 Tax=Vibrio TaxID=662 RepID=A0A7X4LNY8_9VIBR|nr:MULTISPECIES: hexitol phosphatase HxpB [Vibrio]MBF9003048.1 hexitol phosphatase HxpB [Vibrio nitrifigilis]MZI95389.1 hexitol phosphatase HxpB [Vibrio eleionomae]